ncbi:MAG: glycoside hydrolase family 16 protein [Pseudomonadota bacterium]
MDIITNTRLISGKSRLVWSDEFEGPKGAPPDPTKWGRESGGEGWGNRELQYYTDQPENAALDGNSCLAITARAITDADPVNRKCWYGPCRFTSARLLTRGRFSFTYGGVEARIKIPFGQGIWPAFWMLGENIGEVGWPACGEIDIMENIGRESGIVHGTVHGPGYSGANGIGGFHALPEGRAMKDEFHIVAIEWQPMVIRWYMDNHLYFEVMQAQLPRETLWPFDHPFFLLLNMAVGGEWPGSPDDTTLFPQVMLIDFVRIYQTT